MPDLRTIFRAGFVLRWHTHPELSTTRDRIDGHSARVARIILALHPSPSLALIKAALIHDDGESITGDRPYTAAKLPEADAAEKAARQKIWDADANTVLSDNERDWLRMADMLDAYQWARFHAPHLMDSHEWIEHREYVLDLASKLSVGRKVREPVR